VYTTACRDIGLREGVDTTALATPD
jgi:hypothetical protein